ncbi:hypothetical protein CAPTEDRAFT_221220 [Capitella teleta]|uniref:Aldose 1-epimerase n=1 Tax=Capitella teleta TaxID=283909 RepID=R7VE07_CAPTE|nr:hypothetical protein CAPTEDRAFT_221220 [Capitella teleta]|eukprot:ELU17073.1 hypothetical protein CAPTEDRAFT_221220 [Capitella teleta]
MSTVKITKEAFGSTSAGDEVDKYTLTNNAGVSVEIINFGGTIVSIHAPDKNGVTDDVISGYDNVAGYENNPPYFGALIGRVANRICRGKFTLNGKEHQLAINNSPNHLHGGPQGYNMQLWNASVEGSKLILHLTDPDGRENYTGTVQVTVTYELTEDSALSIHYQAKTDQATPLNLTNHTYFNLGGKASPNIYDHLISIAADRYTPKDETCIPTGELAPVDNTPFDLRTPVLLKNRIPLVTEGPPGFDHNFCLNGEGLRCIARVEHAASGRVMEVLTDQPGVQLYTGNFLDGVRGKSGACYQQHHSLALETQVYPDAINQPQFPDCVLKPGEVYDTTTVYKFSCS